MGNFKSITELLQYHQINELEYIIQKSPAFEDLDQRRLLIEDTLGCCRYRVPAYDEFTVFSSKNEISARTLLEKLDGFRDYWDGEKHPVGAFLEVMRKKLVSTDHPLYAESLDYFSDIIDKGAY